MLSTAVLLLAVLAATQAYSSHDIGSGNWGSFTLMNNRKMCYGIDMNRSNRLVSKACNSYEEKQLWRYDTHTHQLQNKGLSALFGSPHCVAVADDGYMYVKKCLAQIYNKFGLRPELGGTVQAFTIESSSGKCLDIEGWSWNNGGRAIPHACESVTRAKSDHWTVFQYSSVYTGGALGPVKQALISDGNWGSITPRTTGGCYSVDAVSLILEQRDCLSSDDAQKFRYDPATQELKNFKYPVNIGGKGCVTAIGNVYYIQRCAGGASSAQRFTLENGVAYDGQFQMLRSFYDSKCVGVQGGHGQGYRRMYHYTCDKRITTSNDQWLIFEFWRASQSCPAGQHVVGNSCKYCPANTYSAKGSVDCSHCPAGYWSNKGSSKCSKTNNCHAGSYMGIHDTVCTLCPINTYSNKAHVTSCTHCGAGFYTDHVGSTSCKRRVQCSPGTFVHAGNCLQCPVNSFSNTHNAAKCTHCPAGFITDGTGATSCRSALNCHPGTFLYSRKCWNCPVNTFSTTFNAMKCTNCPAGYITEGSGSTSCKQSHACVAGTYIHNGGCWKCPKNTFSNVQNAAKCTVCPHRYDTETTGSKTCKVKTFCAPGKFHNGHHCVDCPVNTFDNSVGNVRCQPCPAGQVAPVGSTSCNIANNCAAGSFYNTAKGWCAKCAKNSYTAQGGKTSCNKCPKGWETKDIGAVKCTKINFCAAGKFWNGKRCWNCPKNTYTNKIGSVECIPCGPGYETQQAGSIFCSKVESCNPGNFFNGKDCQACPINTFNANHGAKWCTKCPKGYEAKAVGALACTQIQCTPGSFFNSEQSACNLCPINTFNSKHGAKWCTKCADGWKTTKIGSLSCVKIPTCKPGRFYNGIKCLYCPKNTFNAKYGATFCTKCPAGFETKKMGQKACTKIPPQFNVVSVPQKSSIVCPYNSGSPPCTLFCRFRTSTGISIKNKANVRFYKKVGQSWVKHSKVFYNRETDWFSFKVAAKPTAATAGLYKCEASYGGKVGSAEMTVNIG